MNRHLAKVAVFRGIVALGAFCVVLALSGSARAEASWDPGAIREDLEAGRPLVVHVRVALCSNAQIDCGSPIAGRPRDLAHNIYWGAIFGARRFLERKGSAYTRLSLQKIDEVTLERAVYRRRIPTTRWKLRRAGSVDEIVVLDAVDGTKIDQAVTGFFGAAAHGESIVVNDGDGERTLRVHVAGYVGHNRLMDGLGLPDAENDTEALPSFVLACYSERYFGNKLRRAGSRPLVTTRQLMAPEGYLLEAVLRGIGDGATEKEIRRLAVATYAKWARLSDAQARWIFAPP